MLESFCGRRPFDAEPCNLIAVDHHHTVGIDLHIHRGRRNRDGAAYATTAILFTEHGVSGRVDQQTTFVDTQGATANPAFTVRGLDDKEPFAVNRKIEGISCGREASATHVGGRANHRRRVMCEQPREDAFTFESGRGHVGQIVRDHFLAPLDVPKRRRGVLDSRRTNAGHVRCLGRQ